MQHHVRLIYLALHLISHGAVHIGHDHHKFVAAQSEYEIRGAEAVFQHLGHPLEHQIAHVMAVGVVDTLELIHVHQQQRVAGHIQIMTHEIIGATVV